MDCRSLYKNWRELLGAFVNLASVLKRDHSSLDLQRVAIVNILEEELQELPVKDARQVVVSLTPFPVITHKISSATVS